MSTTDDLASGTIELETGMRPQPLRVLPPIIAIALAILLVFNSQGLAKWSRDLPPTSFNLHVAEAAAWWHDLMTRLGPAKAFEVLHEAIGVKLKP
jgi:hypothetical protein